MSDWIDGTAAVLEAWMMGQAGGGAIADVLFGRSNPSGKLAETFPLALEDTPAKINFPGENGVVRYGEGLFIGYRYYDAKEQPILFPFGHGLNYTTFSYSNARLSVAAFKDVDGVTVSVDVTNIGDVAGKEVVQVYVHDRESRLVRPYKELKGFAKVSLEPGDTKTVTIPLSLRAFTYYDSGYGQWVTEDGAFNILIGASSTDIRATIPCAMESTMTLPSLLHNESTVRDWQNDPRGQAVFMPFYHELQKQGISFLGDGIDARGEAMERNTIAMYLDMPLASVLHFHDFEISRPPEELVEELLQKVHSA
jgi:beta-glucosidase